MIIFGTLFFTIVSLAFYRKSKRWQFLFFSVSVFVTGILLLLLVQNIDLLGLHMPPNINTLLFIPIVLVCACLFFEYLISNRKRSLLLYLQLYNLSLWGCYFVLTSTDIIYLYVSVELISFISTVVVSRFISKKTLLKLFSLVSFSRMQSMILFLSALLYYLSVGTFSIGNQHIVKNDLFLLSSITLFIYLVSKLLLFPFIKINSNNLRYLDRPALILVLLIIPVTVILKLTSILMIFSNGMFVWHLVLFQKLVFWMGVIGGFYSAIKMTSNENYLDYVKCSASMNISLWLIFLSDNLNSFNIEYSALLIVIVYGTLLAGFYFQVEDSKRIEESLNQGKSYLILRKSVFLSFGFVFALSPLFIDIYLGTHFMEKLNRSTTIFLFLIILFNLSNLFNFPRNKFIPSKNAKSKHDIIVAT